ncbi:UNVERIFIED_CONTAM: hypothetical protein FKN15_061419 [Acipenser sinensis]
MASLGLLLCTLALCAHESSGQIVLTQSPTVESVSIGGSVTLNCRSSSSGFTSSLAWYLQKPGGAPKLLFSSLNSQVSGAPAPFTDSRSRTNFMLTISGVQADGVWNGARQWLIQLFKDPEGIGGVRHLPSNVTLGAARGFVVYNGMPKLCRNCGQLGHLAQDVEREEEASKERTEEQQDEDGSLEEDPYSSEFSENEPDVSAEEDNADNEMEIIQQTGKRKHEEQAVAKTRKKVGGVNIAPDVVHDQERGHLLAHIGKQEKCLAVISSPDTPTRGLGIERTDFQGSTFLEEGDVQTFSAVSVFLKSAVVAEGESDKVAATCKDKDKMAATNKAKDKMAATKKDKDQNAATNKGKDKGADNNTMKDNDNIENTRGDYQWHKAVSLLSARKIVSAIFLPAQSAPFKVQRHSQLALRFHQKDCSDVTAALQLFHTGASQTMVTTATPHRATTGSGPGPFQPPHAPCLLRTRIESAVSNDPGDTECFPSISVGITMCLACLLCTLALHNKHAQRQDFVAQR